MADRGVGRTYGAKAGATVGFTAAVDLPLEL